MDMMAWNDLDIDVENDKMSLDKLYSLTDYIIKTFHPVWYEAKQELIYKNTIFCRARFATLLTPMLPIVARHHRRFMILYNQQALGR